MSHFVYVAAQERLHELNTRQPLKIGMAQDPEARLRTLQTGNHEPLVLVAEVEFDDRKKAAMAEKIALTILDDNKAVGEWVMVPRMVVEIILDILRSRQHELHLWFDQEWMEANPGAHPNN